MSEHKPSPTDLPGDYPTESIHIAGPDYNRMYEDTKLQVEASKHEALDTAPNLGSVENLHLEPFASDPRNAALAIEFAPTDAELATEADILELIAWVHGADLDKDSEGYRLQNNHHDQVGKLRGELATVRRERLDAWKQAMEPLLAERLPQLQKLPAVTHRQYSELANTGNVQTDEIVNLDRIIAPGNMADWSGRGSMKTPSHGTNNGRNISSQQYILELAADMVVGNFDTAATLHDEIRLYPFRAQSGDVVFTAGGGQHRVAALKLLGQRDTPARVVWPEYASLAESRSRGQS